MSSNSGGYTVPSLSSLTATGGGGTDLESRILQLPNTCYDMLSVLKG